MKKVMIGAVLAGVAGFVWVRSRPTGAEQVLQESIERTAEPEEPQQEEAKPLELPMYEVGGKKKQPVPMVKLGEPLRVGPVTLTVKANSLTYIAARRQLSDGSLTKKDEPVASVTEFHVTIENLGDGMLDLNPRKAYWITDEKNLYQTAGFDPQINWIVAGRGGRYLTLPDEAMAEALQYDPLDRALVKWMLNEKGLRRLPDKVLPGEKAEGSIVLVYTADPETYYLCFGNWIQKKAWGCVELGTMEGFLQQAVETIGPNPPTPWIEE